MEDLDERLLNTKLEGSEEKDRIRMATAYFISSLKLMAAIISDKVPARNLMIVRYYRYEILNKGRTTAQEFSETSED